ncbi:MAG: aminotransferase class IV, partial [Bacilli bacterium]
VKLASQWRTGQQMILAEDIRWKHCHIKSLNLLPNVWTKQIAIDSGAHDAIFVRDDHVTECTSSNIAIVHEGVIVTHPANEWILHGVTRRFVLEYAKKTGLPVEETEFPPDSLFKADEVFTMGTLSEVTPVNMIDGREVGPYADAPGSMIRKLRSAIREAVKLA